MVSVIKRMKKLRALLAIRFGPGAAILPPEVRRIHMDFAFKIDDGHMGSRKFWRSCLPRLKFHNPAVSMTVNRTTLQDGPAIMTIHFSDSTSVANTHQAVSSTTSSNSSTTPTVRVETINMKHKHESEILSQLMLITKAQRLNPRDEEIQQIEQLKAERMQRKRDAETRELQKEAKKRTDAILSQARGD